MLRAPPPPALCLLSHVPLHTSRAVARQCSCPPPTLLAWRIACRPNLAQPPPRLRRLLHTRLAQTASLTMLISFSSRTLQIRQVMSTQLKSTQLTLAAQTAPPWRLPPAMAPSPPPPPPRAMLAPLHPPHLSRPVPLSRLAGCLRRSPLLTPRQRPSTPPRPVTPRSHARRQRCRGASGVRPPPPRPSLPSLTAMMSSQASPPLPTMTSRQLSLLLQPGPHAAQTRHRRCAPSRSSSHPRRP